MKPEEAVNVDLVPAIESIDVPEDWDYSASVERVKGNVYKARNLSEEIIREIWVAHEKLAKEGNPHRDVTDANATVTFDDYCRDIGVNRSTAWRWLSRAKLLPASRAADEEPNTDLETCTVEDLTTHAETGQKYACIYADPPWKYGNQATRASTDNHYDTMTVDEICALPVSSLAADNAHLHIWTTNAFLFDTKRVMESWGFEYKSCFVWVKPQMGIGNYWRVSHEFLLFGIRGTCPFLDRGLLSWGSFDRTGHSVKPEEVRRLIERASPGPRIELFGRRVSEGWAVWGNEIEKTMFQAEVAAV